MELAKAILTRRSVRNFRQGNIPDDRIRELIKAAIYAPSAGNCQPWHFYVVKDPGIRKRVYEEACRQEFLTDASVLIIVCIDRNERGGRYGERGEALYNIQNTAAAVQNILLSATDMGLGSCWCGDFDVQSLQEILQMDSSRIPVAIVAVGYAGFEPPAPVRRPIDEVATFIGEWEACEEEKAPEARKIEHCDMGGTVFRDVNLYGKKSVLNRIWKNISLPREAIKKGIRANLTANLNQTKNGKSVKEKALPKVFNSDEFGMLIVAENTGNDEANYDNAWNSIIRETKKKRRCHIRI